MSTGGGVLAAAMATAVVLSMVIPIGAIAGQPTRDADRTPAEVAAPGSGTPNQAVADTAGLPSVGKNAKPVVRKLVAIEIVRNAHDGATADQANHTERAVTRFNATLPLYTDGRRLSDSSAFTDDAIGIEVLGNLNATNQSDRAERAADLVFEADNESARTAVEDARRVLRRFGDSMANQGRRRAAEAHLANAEKALDRAETARSSSSAGRTYFQARARAVKQLRTAHRHAHKVLRFVDEDTTPRVAIDRRDDPVRNGSEKTEYGLSGTVSAARPSSIGAVRVTINDDRTTTARLAPGAGAPGRNISFFATIDLTQRVNEIEVRPTEAERRNNSGNGNARAKKGNGRGDGGGGKARGSRGNAPGNNGKGKAKGKNKNRPGTGGAAGSSQGTTATLRLDGDGLPDAFEVDDLETDPLDPDSDAGVTGVDEADDGTTDGREDFDGDNLTTIRELELGTDPLSADTDGDGLQDDHELTLTGTDPLLADSDGDGTSDGAEDPDGDGLSNAGEIQAGTFPDVADSDGDGLSDSVELDAGTDPLSFDTDEDFLADGREGEAPFNTDPLNPDTDSDGVLDGNETYTTATENRTLGASVSLTGQGDVAAETTIKQPRHARFTDGRAPASVAASEFVEVDADVAFESATVTLGYDESAIQTNESSLAVYRVNETSGVYERLPSEVDPSSDTVRATTDHFSPVVVLDTAAALATIRQRNQPASAGPGGTVQTIVFDYETNSPVVIDSGSSETVNGNTWSCRNDPFSPPHSDTPISGECVIRDGKAVVREETNRQRYLEHTLTFPDVDSGEALFVNASVTAHIESRWANSALRLVIEDGSGQTLDVFRLKRDFSTGEETVSANPTVNVTQFAGERVTISFRSNGRWTYTFQDTMATIEADHVTVERRRGATTDSDGDGISDAQERAGVPLAGTVKTANLDPTDPDTDGDGRLDGEEVDTDTFVADQDVGDDNIIAFPGYAWSSDPTDGDTDGDGLTDRKEVDQNDRNRILTVNKSGSAFRWEPRLPESNGSFEWTSDPQDPDTDDDGLADDTEVRRTHTHPRLPVTYGITERNQRFVDDLAASPLGQRRGIAVGVIDTGESLRDVELTDATDDFDFVWDDTAGSDPFDRLTFQMIDDSAPEQSDVVAANLRSDRWLSNTDELAFNELSDFLDVPRSSNAQLGVWDPDSDDDGLTDGQELFGMTRGTNRFRGRRTIVDHVDLDTSPVLADTDGDSHWDGWIGVYDVGRTDNVILYEEHLVSGGVEGVDIVQEQIQTHERREEAPFGFGADIDGDGDDEHSNLHLGERFWGTDPLGSASAPSPSMTFEVDYHSAADSALDSTEWRESIEDNYALYGISVDLQRDEELSDAQLRAINAGSPYSTHNLLNIESVYHDTNADLYLFVGSTAGLTIPAGENQTGVHRTQSIPVIFHQRLVAIFTTGHLDDLDQAPSGLSRDDRMRAVSTKTAVHEIGHVLDLGETDDQNGEEVYSGDGNDQTPEFVNDRSESLDVARWSVMSNGVNDVMFLPPTNEDYTAFSIEEWLSMKTSRVNP